MPVHLVLGYVEQFMLTSQWGMDRSSSISSAGVVICILGQVAALGHRGPALLGEAPSPLCSPGSPKLTDVTELEWEAIVKPFLSPGNFLRLEHERL